MDPESIKEIIVAIENLSGEAKEAFAWFLIAKLICPLVWTIGGLALTATLIRKTFSAIHAHSGCRHYRRYLSNWHGEPWELHERALRCLQAHFKDYTKDQDKDHD